MIRALTKQTGLPRKTIALAVKEKVAAQGDPRRGYAGQRLAYALNSKGGDVRLRYFGARETRSGVTARPWGVRTAFPGAFITGGSWPRRTALPFGGHVFRRAGASRLPIVQLRSGLWIPQEMVSKESAKAFERIMGADLQDRVSHELGFLLRKAGL